MDEKNITVDLGAIEKIFLAFLVIAVMALPIKIKHAYQTSEENTTRIVEAMDRQTSAIQEQAYRTRQLSILTVCGTRGGSLKPDEESGGIDRIKCD